jgi:hypothetical protein
MNERPDGVAAHQTEQPEDQQNDGDGVQHGLLLCYLRRAV